jgi:hypothetical protein
MRIPAQPADPRAWSARGAAADALGGQAREPRSSEAAAWFAVGAFAVYVALGLAGAGGRALTITFPVGCLIVGLFTYMRSPTTYLAFAWWAWLLTPFVRRVFDLRYGFHPTSPILLGPLLVTAIALFTLVRRRNMLRSTAYLPFVVAAAALAYAFLIGVLRQSIAAASYDLLTWLAPLLFGLHLALEWRQFPRTRSTIAACVLWGLMVTALYGIWQFVQPPLWDRAWVVSAEMQSVGMPLPFLIRVFSTLNAPGPFSIMLVFALLLGLAAPQKWRALPLALGLVALILTKGRSAWGAFLVGALVLQLRQPLRSLPRQWVALLAVILLAAPVITQPKVMSVLTRRAATVRNLDEDNSYQNRVLFTQYAFKQMARNPAGTGLGSLGGASKLLVGTKSGFALDSGPLEIFNVMGWIGGSLFSLALMAIILPIVRGRKLKFETMTSAAVSVVVALLGASLFGNIFNGVSGFLFWSAVGIATAGRTYAAGVAIASRYAGQPPAVPVRPGPWTPGRRPSAA